MIVELNPLESVESDDRQRYPEAFERYADGRTLSSRQRQVYLLIVRHAERYGVVPTYRQLLSMLGFTSPNAIKERIDILERRGLVRRGEGRQLILPRRQFSSSPIRNSEEVANATQG